MFPKEQAVHTHGVTPDLSFGCPKILFIPESPVESGIIVLQYIAFDPEPRNYSSYKDILKYLHALFSSVQHLKIFKHKWSQCTNCISITFPQ